MDNALDNALSATPAISPNNGFAFLLIAVFLLAIFRSSFALGLDFKEQPKPCQRNI
jgi:hypothetical protein